MAMLKKRLIICCDGTWNTPDETNEGQSAPTNVTKVALCVAPQDSSGIEQRAFYEKGVGTGRWDRLRGGAFGSGLSAKVKEAYQFLVANYEAGDELFFFGFSRGAYTARSTVGLIRNSGLLMRQHADKVDAAYELYRRRDDASSPTSVEAELFRKSYSYTPRIKFIGVWDTVGELGLPGPAFRFLNKGYEFHDVKLSSWVDNAFQALAIDERRKFFEPSVWEQQQHSVGQVVEQVWFAGVHCNVGGGYNTTGLSDVALRWMVTKAEGCGLAFDRPRFNKIITPDPLDAMRDSKTLLYKAFPDYNRPIGVTKAGNERVASSATDRLTKNPDYKPQNLLEYLARGGKTAQV